MMPPKAAPSLRPRRPALFHPTSTRPIGRPAFDGAPGVREPLCLRGLSCGKHTSPMTLTVNSRADDPAGQPAIGGRSFGPAPPTTPRRVDIALRSPWQPLTTLPCLLRAVAPCTSPRPWRVNL